MNTPDKIYLDVDTKNDEIFRTWYDEPCPQKDATTGIACIEYIRKDAIIDWARRRREDTLESLKNVKKGKGWAFGQFEPVGTFSVEDARG